MERKLREEILAEVQKAVTQAMTKVSERWISAKELCNQFQMFTKDWIDEYGDCLPRKRVRVTHINGKKRSTHWAYAQHRIAMNIDNGLYDDMKLLRLPRGGKADGRHTTNPSDNADASECLAEGFDCPPSDNADASECLTEGFDSPPSDNERER